MKIEHENLLKKAFEDGVNTFLGAGFSILASSQDGRTLPIGRQLSDELMVEFNVHHLSKLTLSKLCTVLESSQKDKLKDYLKKRFSVVSFDTKYYSFMNLNIKNIFTTNIDDLIYKIYSTSETHYINDVSQRGPAYADKLAIDYIPLHGSVVNQYELAFSTLDVVGAFDSDPDKWHFLTEAIQKFPTVFIGYGMEDAGILKALNPKTIRGREHRVKWVTLLEEDQGTIEYFKALGFSVIISDTKSLLEYFSSRKTSISQVGGTVPVSSTSKLFPTEGIPLPNQAPVRPLLEFFIGSPPVWSDVFSGRVPKTSHYLKTLDAVNSGKNVLILGLPGSGKSTLMMQAAKDFNFKGHKLILDALSRQKVELIVRKLDSQKAAIFVDNFTDDIDSFQFLLSHTNLQVIGFDRDYNYEIASHRLDTEHCVVIDVTELDEPDMQLIYSNIPPEIRKLPFSKPSVAEGHSASLFELIEANLGTPSLKFRFLSVLQQLSQNSIDLHDLLVMCCYIHSCRTPVSFEMVLSFLRQSAIDYEIAFEKVHNLGSLLSGYKGGLVVDEEQDYYVPRSIYVSEAVLQQVSPSALKRVITHFHEEVSPFRICRYDIFKRKAFDAKIMTRAFQEWEEGKKFYELMFQRDSSPYVLQQGALYLSNKHRYTDAFTWIDEARSMTADRVFSIRNSYAVILFRSNIDFAGKTIEIRNTIDESMQILQKCYTDDKRKRYHAVTFAEQALKYSEIYFDSKSKDYLLTADKWLKEEKKNSPWHRGIRRLLGEIDREMKRYS